MPVPGSYPPPLVCAPRFLALVQHCTKAMTGHPKASLKSSGSSEPGCLMVEKCSTPLKQSNAAYINFYPTFSISIRHALPTPISQAVSLAICALARKPKKIKLKKVLDGLSIIAMSVNSFLRPTLMLPISDRKPGEFLGQMKIGDCDSFLPA